MAVWIPDRPILCPSGMTTNDLKPAMAGWRGLLSITCLHLGRARPIPVSRRHPIRKSDGARKGLLRRHGLGHPILDPSFMLALGADDRRPLSVGALGKNDGRRVADDLIHLLEPIGHRRLRSLHFIYERSVRRGHFGFAYLLPRQRTLENLARQRRQDRVGDDVVDHPSA